MKVWIVKDYEDTIVDIFKTRDGAYNYLLSELDRWNDEFPEEFDDFNYGCCKQVLFSDYVEQKQELRAGLVQSIYDSGFYLRAKEYEVKE